MARVLTQPISPTPGRFAGVPVLGLVLGLVLAAGAAGCTARQAGAGEQSRPPPVARPRDNGTEDCFYIRDVQDFRPVGRTDLLVFAPNRSRVYQVRIAPPATGLRFSDAVVFESRSNRICGYAGDGLVVPDAGGPRRYSIIEVARLNPETADLLLGRGDGPEAPAPEARPGAGAQVERDLD